MQDIFNKQKEVQDSSVVPSMETTHGVTREQWSNEILSEYLSGCFLFNFMGTSSHNVIQVKEELNKMPGDSINLQLRTKDNQGNSIFFDQRITVDTLRHAVALKGDMIDKRIAFDLRNQAREALVDWAEFKLTEQIVKALCNTSKGRDRSRYLYGATDANWHSTHATAFMNVDSTNDKLCTSLISRAKRKALLEGIAPLRPFVYKEGEKIEEIFVLFAHPYALRDLSNDADFKALNTHIPASIANCVLAHSQRFKGMWDGVAIFEMLMPLYSDSGAAGITLAHNILCGAQAVGVTYGKRTNYKEDLDPNDFNGFAVDEIRGIEKCVFNGVDHGIVNVFTAAVED